MGFVVDERVFEDNKIFPHLNFKDFSLPTKLYNPFQDVLSSSWGFFEWLILFQGES